jgi:hypothetical protein
MPVRFSRETGSVMVWRWTGMREYIEPVITGDLGTFICSIFHSVIMRHLSAAAAERMPGNGEQGAGRICCVPGCWNSRLPWTASSLVQDGTD